MDPILGIGSKISVDRGAGYVDIVKMVEIGEFGLEGDDVEVTNHDSSGGVREYIRGLTDPSEISFTGIWVADATQVDLMEDVLLGMSQPNLPYKITLAQGRGVFTFDGYLKAFTINPNLDDRMECSGTFKMAGIPTFGTTAVGGLTTPFFLVTPSAGAAATYVPTRSGSVYDYVVTCENAATTFTVTPTDTDASDVIEVNGTVVASGAASGAINLGAAGSVTTCVITVSQTGQTPLQYVLHVVRAA